MRAAVLALLVAGCAHAPVAPAGLLTTKTLPAWLFCVERDDSGKCAVFRSAQPTRAEFAEMQRVFGLKSVVKLNSALEGRDAVPDGVERYEHPWLPAGPVDHDDVQEALDDLESAPRPVLAHCTHGEDRTGLLIAIYRVRHGSLPFAAWMEWLAYGHVDSLLFRALRETFERETGWSAP